VPVGPSIPKPTALRATQIAVFFWFCFSELWVQRAQENESQHTLLSSFQSEASLACPSHRCTGSIASAAGKQSESELHLRWIVIFLRADTEMGSMI
jgi:hypothetical protein